MNNFPNVKIRICETALGKVILCESYSLLSYRQMLQVEDRCDVQVIDAPIVFATFSDAVQPHELLNEAYAYHHRSL